MNNNEMLTFISVYCFTVIQASLIWTLETWIMVLNNKYT